VILQVLPSYLGGTAELIDIQQAAQRRTALHGPTKQPYAYDQQQRGRLPQDELFKEPQEALNSSSCPQHVLVAVS
jgi:hypothetical protein